MENPYSNQPMRLRLEALMSAGSYDDPGNIVLVDPDSVTALSDSLRTAGGVEAEFGAASAPAQPPSGEESKSEAERPGDPAALFLATHSGQVDQKAAWARVDRTFDPWLSLKQHQALGVWVEGDGQGALLAIRLESPRHISFGAVADRYVTVDFTGRRQVTLVETESARWNDYIWNDGKGLYNVYRETIDFGAVASISLWLHNLPSDKEVRCRIGAVKALPMVRGTVKNPALTVNGQELVFPGVMESGCFLEFDGGASAILYGPKGEIRAEVAPRGVVPTLRAGANQIQFGCDPAEGASPRVKVVLMVHGHALAP
jgi:hypothetical protein